MPGSPASVIAVARRYVGYHEGSNNDNIFGRWYGMNHVPWCAEFVSYCMYAGGQPLHITTSKGYAYCLSGEAYFKGHNAWHPSTQSRPGDIIFFTGHTGLVEVGWNGHYTVTIEGNEGDGVRRVHRDAGSYTHGVGRPVYSGSTAPPVTHPPVSSVGPQWPGRFFALTSPLTHGADVKTWQTQMAHRGWKIGVDGIYGPATASVCRAFQKEKHLTVDGVVGAQTWHAAWSVSVT